MRFHRSPSAPYVLNLRCVDSRPACSPGPGTRLYWTWQRIRRPSSACKENKHRVGGSSLYCRCTPVIALSMPLAHDVSERFKECPMTSWEIGNGILHSNGESSHLHFLGILLDHAQDRCLNGPCYAARGGLYFYELFSNAPLIPRNAANNISFQSRVPSILRPSWSTSLSDISLTATHAFPVEECSYEHSNPNMIVKKPHKSLEKKRGGTYWE